MLNSWKCAINNFEEVAEFKDASHAALHVFIAKVLLRKHKYSKCLHLIDCLVLTAQYA